MSDNKTGTPETQAAGERRAFATEVQQLLHLMIHSLYSKREVFLRELVSNASDAIDTARFLALTEKDLRDAGEAAIDLAVDKDQKTITISDNGVGMTREQVIENIGTIARSGSGALLKQLKERGEKSAPELIGQFGVGFYASFMVADRVELETLSVRPGAEPVLWTSAGDGAYTLAPGRRTSPGTTVTLHLKDDASEFLEEWRLEQIVREYSNYVKWPIRHKGKALNQSTALWQKRPAEVSDDEHRHFYQELVGGMEGEEPLARLHLQLDAPYQFQAIVYIPKKPPFDMMFADQQSKRRGMQLYVRRVFILDHAEELLPPYLRFLRGVVDSDDLPLNVSREILQKNPVITTIQKQIVKKTIEELKRVKAERPEDYAAFWAEFGPILKEGLFLDNGNRDKLAELALFPSWKTPEGKQTSLGDYVAAMPAGQKEIYYITGPSREQVEHSPHLEALRRRGVDVLLLHEPVDEWVVQGLTEFDGKKLRSVVKGDFSLPDVPEAAKAEAQKLSPEDEERVGGLIAFLRVRFQDSVKEVRLTERLADSPSCLVAGEGDLGRNLEQILLRGGRKVQEAKPILEVNGKSPFVLGLARRVKEQPAAEETGQLCDLLLDLAYLAQGAVRRPGPLVAQLARLLEKTT